MIEKRKEPQLTEQELYATKNVNNIIIQERRKDELDRLYEIQQQKRVWKNVAIIAIIINTLLILLAIIGYVKGVNS